MGGRRRIMIVGLAQRLPSPRRRRGMAVLMVVLLLSITLGLSYAMVRFQNTAVQVEHNMDRREAARHAAITGLSMAIKKMQTSAWGGVGSTLSGSLSVYEQYSVTYTTGDAVLTSASPDWNEFPYRVTLDSTGTAADPADSARISAHKIRAVMKLVPRNLADNPNPTGWVNAVTRTLCQYSANTFTVSVPFRVSGSVQCSSTLSFVRDYSWSDTIRSRYLLDLERMRSTNPDCRPFTGPVLLPYSAQEAGLISLLSNSSTSSPAGMAIPTENAPGLSYSSFFGSPADTYRLYTGGQAYSATTLAQDCRDNSWAPDPVNNPAGIYVRYGTVDVNSNASFQGTIIARTSGSGDVHVRGRNVKLLAQNLPSLYGESQPVRLPTIVAQDDFRIHEGSQGLLQGLMNVTDEFEIVADQQDDINVTMQMRVIAMKFLIRGRSEWNYLPWWWWDDCYYSFTHQGSNPIAYFPLWLAKYIGLNYAPRLTIEPEATAFHYHWCNPQNGLYVAHPDDGGLRWEMVRWIDNP